jgi:hypothetical protein
MHSSTEKEQERSMAIKLLMEKWVKKHEIKSKHEIKPKKQLKSDRSPIPAKKNDKPSDS